MDIKKLAMMIVIAILIPLFIALFIDALYSEPQYEDYCDFEQYPRSLPIKEEQDCEFEYSAEQEECYASKGIPRFDYDSDGCQVYKECDFCSKDYEEARDVYNRNVFFIFAILSLAIIVAGVYLKTDYIGAGLMFGGVITLFYSTIRYMSSMDKMLRALVILMDLIIIIWISYKKIDHK
jgi:hypothetical protein